MKFLVAISLFRHGDRTFLIEPKSKDPTPAEWIKANKGTGQLTAEGKAQNAKVGAAMKARYLNGVEEYDRNFIHVRSSDYDRTLMSAEAQLNAMWNSSFVPIHTVPGDEDILLRGFSSDVCPKLVAINPTKIINDAAYNVNLESDHILVSRAHGFVDKLGHSKEQIDAFLEAGDEYFSKYLSPERCAIGGGPLASQIHFILDHVARGQQWSNKAFFDASLPRPQERLEDPKLVLFSAHDTTVMQILIILGMFDGIVPPYASGLVFEMDTNHCITLWYNDDLDNMFSKTEPLCDVSCCTVAHLEARLNGVGALYSSIDSWRSHCNAHYNEYFGLIFIVIVIGGLYVTYRLSVKGFSRKSTIYDAVPTEFGLSRSSGTSECSAEIEMVHAGI